MDDNWAAMLDRLLELDDNILHMQRQLDRHVAAERPKDEWYHKCAFNLDLAKSHHKSVMAALARYGHIRITEAREQRIAARAHQLAMEAAAINADREATKAAEQARTKELEIKAFRLQLAKDRLKARNAARNAAEQARTQQEARMARLERVRVSNTENNLVLDEMKKILRANMAPESYARLFNQVMQNVEIRKAQVKEAEGPAGEA